MYMKQSPEPDLGYPQESATIIHEDNQGCIALSKNPILTSMRLGPLWV